MFSQFSNAEWLRRLQVATVMMEREYNVTNATDVIGRLLSGNEQRGPLEEYSCRSGFDADMKLVCTELERLGRMGQPALT